MNKTKAPAPKTAVKKAPVKTAAKPKPVAKKAAPAKAPAKAPRAGDECVRRGAAYPGVRLTSARVFRAFAASCGVREPCVRRGWMVPFRVTADCAFRALARASGGAIVRGPRVRDRGGESRDECRGVARSARVM